jgi:biopolymer transport protein ExbD
MRFRQRKSKADTEAGILPLINVVFLLLIFFMLAGQLTAAGPFPVMPPESAAAGAPDLQQEGEPREAVILLAADGRLALDGALVEEAALKAALAERLAAVPGLPVHLKADGDAEAAAVVAVMETLRDAGVRRLQLFAQASAQAGPEGEAQP